MRDHTNYRAAKDGIDNDAALDLAYELLIDEKVEQVRLSLDGTFPRVVPVHAEELPGRNKIPMAYAKVLAEALGLTVEPQIVQASVANHGGSASIYHRLVSPAIFDGPVTPGAEYLIVDDTCAAGGTLANLKGFIEINGGVVVAMSVLALGRDASLPIGSRLRTAHLEGLLTAIEGWTLSGERSSVVESRLSRKERRAIFSKPRPLASYEIALLRQDAISTSTEMDRLMKERVEKGITTKRRHVNRQRPFEPL